MWMEPGLGWVLWPLFQVSPKVALRSIPTARPEPVSSPLPKPHPGLGCEYAPLLETLYKWELTAMALCSALGAAAAHTARSGSKHTSKPDDHGICLIIGGWWLLQTWHHGGLSVSLGSGLMGLTGSTEGCPLKGPVGRIWVDV